MRGTKAKVLRRQAFEDYRNGLVRRVGRFTNLAQIVAGPLRYRYQQLKGRRR